MKNRDGSYKKILLNTETLKGQGNFLRENLKELKNLNLSPQDFTTLYIILFLRIKHPKNWLQKKASVASDTIGVELLSIIPESFALNAWEKEKLNGITAHRLFTSFNLKAIPESINRTMIQWFQGNWHIEMLEYIPVPRELLSLQVKNSRCVTVITDPNEVDSIVMNARDPLSFVLHDLMHADQFFNHHESLKGQLGFYELISKIYDQPELRLLIKQDKNFKKEFEYITTDMNAYVIHLFKCLKSSLYRANKVELFNQLEKWWSMSAEEIFSSQKLNTPDFSKQDELILKKFFERKQHILPNGH